MPATRVRSPHLRQHVTVGELSFLADGPDLRYVRWGGIEIVRRIYVTVRDEDWNAPAINLRCVELDADDRRCALAVEAASMSSTVEVDWQVRAEAQADGRLGYGADFAPQRSFRYSRMGLCVLFPPAALAGRRYEAWAGDARCEGQFETLIAPQLISGEEILPLFPAFDRVRVNLDDVGTLELSFTGDLLEMEDQRNWSDSSFKAYCTPLSIPRPHLAEPARPVSQRVEIAVSPHSDRRRRRRSPRDAIAITIGEPTGMHAPTLGTLLREASLDAPALAALRETGLEHLRVEFRRPGELAMQLEPAAALACRAGAALAPALFFSGDMAEIEAAADRLAALQNPPARILVFPSDEPSERGRLSQLLRGALAGRLPGVPIIGGTDVWFVDLNRGRPDQTAMDGVAWSITPQVHSQDSLTVIEGLEAQSDQVRTAHSFAPDLQLVVGPITLRPRYNPNARDAREQAVDPPLASIDPCQADMLTAAWTVGSLRALAEAGVTAATYYEAAGPRGIMSLDGRPYPVQHVLATAAGWARLPVLSVVSEEPSQAQAFAVAATGSDRASSILVANLADSGQRIQIGLPLAQSVRICMLGEEGSSSKSEVLLKGGVLELDLGAYAIAAVAV